MSAVSAEVGLEGKESCRLLVLPSCHVLQPLSHPPAVAKQPISCLATPAKVSKSSEKRVRTTVAKN